MMDLDVLEKAIEKSVKETIELLGLDWVRNNLSWFKAGREKYNA